jgi:hypothetical protein
MSHLAELKALGIPNNGRETTKSAELKSTIRRPTAVNMRLRGTMPEILAGCTTVHDERN